MSRPARMPPAHDPTAHRISAVPSFEMLQAAVRTGSGIVARFPGIVLTAAVHEIATVHEIGDEAGAETGAGKTVERLLQICREVSAARSRAPGRSVARRLAGWLAGLDEPVDFGVVSATDDALAVFLCGRATLLIPGVDALSGTQAAAWVDRLIGWPSTGLLLTLGGSEAARPAPETIRPTPLLDLRMGVVPGAGVLLTTEAPAGPRQPVTPPSHEADPPPEPGPPLDQPTVRTGLTPPHTPRRVPEPPIRAETISGVAPEGPPRSPLPRTGDTPVSGPRNDREGEPDRTGPGELEQCAFVEGYLCSRGHLNDPRALFCASCGIRMAERTGVPVRGMRPPLGMLVFDDGTSFTLDEDYLLGRQPNIDERVRNGSVRPLMISDGRRLVSRAHLEIQLKGWDVYINDTGTANGTHVQVAEAQEASALVPGRPLRLPPGARVIVGSRSFVFESSLAPERGSHPGADAIR